MATRSSRQRVVADEVHADEDGSLHQSVGTALRKGEQNPDRLGCRPDEQVDLCQRSRTAERGSSRNRTLRLKATGAAAPRTRSGATT